MTSCDVSAGGLSTTNYRPAWPHLRRRPSPYRAPLRQNHEKVSTVVVFTLSIMFVLFLLMDIVEIDYLVIGAHHIFKVRYCSEKTSEIPRQAR